MQNRRLGNSDLWISPLGIGAWAMGGGGWEFGWSAQDDNDSIAAIHTGLDAGMNWIDTAPVYGMGHSEEIVGKAIKGQPNKPYLFTKCSFLWDHKGEIYRSLKADTIRVELESSLRRLKADTIDLYQIHWPNPEPDIEEAWTTLAQLQQEGKVRWIGVSNFNVKQMKRMMSIAPITSLQPPYSLLRRGIEGEILQFTQANNIGVIVYSPMQAGLLTGAMTKERAANLDRDDWRKNSEDFREPNLSRNLQLVELLREIGSRHGHIPGEVAIAWTLRNPAVTGAITGLRNAGQVKGIIGAMDFRLNEEEIAQIEDYLVVHGM